MTSRRLTLDDIADARAYEREREALRDRVIAVKKLRRVSVGPVLSAVFENRDTIRFQIQEMARAERLYTDQAIQTELDTYNPLIPEAGQLSASVFIELTSRAEMEQWLPKLVGIEGSLVLELGPGGRDNGHPEPEVVRSDVDPQHAASLTRESVTAAVHFVRWSLTPAQIERFRDGTVALAVDHPAYRQSTVLTEATRTELLTDLLA